MTSAQYRAALAKIGMTQQEAADFLGVSVRTSNSYANDGVIPEATAKLLRLMIKLDLTALDAK
jgi:DNA-binding XRE family transcriptional regulator